MVKRLRTFVPVWLVSRAVVFSILVADTCLPLGGMESYDVIRFLGIVVCGLGCIAGDCDAECASDCSRIVAVSVGGLCKIG